MKTWTKPIVIVAVGVAVLCESTLGEPVIGPMIRIDYGGGTAAANETTASASDVNPMEIIAGWNDWRLSGSSEIINSGFSLSMDGGLTWTDFLIRPPVQNQSNVEGDPMSAFDPRTGTLWAGAISFSAGSNSGVYVARKDPGSPTFEPSVMARTSSGTDKCWMAAGIRPGMPDTTRLYVGFNQGIIWSDDMGDTWTSPTSLGSGLGWLPRIGPNGEVYVAYWDYSGSGNNYRMKRSLNGGASFTTHHVATRMDAWSTYDTSRFPGTFRVPALLYLDVDENNGNLYAAYFDTTNIVGGNYNVDIYFTKSTDQGTSWTTPVVINTDEDPPGDQFFCWLEVDKYGRIHLVWFDSRHTVQNDNNIHGMLDAYYAYSEDEGATWHEYRLTDSPWDSDNDGLNRSSQFIGDYLGLAVADNKVYPVYLYATGTDPDTYTHVIEFAGACPADLNGDDYVNIDDIFAALGLWGDCPDPCPPYCAGDLTEDCTVNIDDIFAILGMWGPCE